MSPHCIPIGLEPGEREAREEHRSWAPSQPENGLDPERTVARKQALSPSARNERVARPSRGLNDDGLLNLGERTSISIFGNLRDSPASREGGTGASTRRSLV